MNRLLCIILVASLLFCSTACNDAPNELSGKWRSVSSNNMGLTITFRDDNSFITEAKGTDVKELIVGRYRVQQDTLYIRDTLDKPLVLCNYDDTGSYVFTKHNDTFLFKTVNENCESRKLAFEIGLVKIK